MKNGPQDIMSGILGGKKWKTVDKKSEIKYLVLKILDYNEYIL